VHDTIGLVSGKGGIDDGAVFQVAEDEFGSGVDRGAVSLLEVVKDNNLVTSPDKFMDNGTADIPSTACDKYFHDFTFL